ncbi:MAG: hypothetical protein N3A71_04140 [Candidatus Dojkabacteria bacterium]|nr:hypothetical protein [Candidatus Dojkabacteria bacterium]
MKNSIAPKEVLDVIEKYKTLRYKEFVTAVPYYRNKPFSFFTPPAEAGKGSPDEIQRYIDEIIARSPQAQKINSNEMFRSVLISFQIGVDCSGFVYHVLDAWAKVKHKKPLSYFLPKESPIFFRKFLSRIFKPQSSMSADDFTSEPFARQIKGTLNIRAGDLIRTKNGDHVLIIISTEIVGDNYEIVAYQSSDSHIPHGLVKTLIHTPCEYLDISAGYWTDIGTLRRYEQVSYSGYISGGGSIWRPRFLEIDEI